MECETLLSGKGCALRLLGGNHEGDLWCDRVTALVEKGTPSDKHAQRAQQLEHFRELAKHTCNLCPGWKRRSSTNLSGSTAVRLAGGKFCSPQIVGILQTHQPLQIRKANPF